MVTPEVMDVGRSLRRGYSDVSHAGALPPGWANMARLLRFEANNNKLSGQLFFSSDLLLQQA